MSELKCVKDPCFCWNEEVYKPSEDTWFLWEAIEALPYIGGLGIEIGCGSGALLNVISKKVDKVIGIDLNPISAKACKLCDFEVLVCNSMSCIGRGANLVVSNLPYLPCEDDPAVCDKWAGEILRFLNVKEGGLLVLLYSSLTSIDVRKWVEERTFEIIETKRRSLGLEDLMIIISRKRSRRGHRT